MIRDAAERIGVVVVGYGYWGPNIVRNVLERPELELLALCELDAAQGGQVHGALLRGSRPSTTSTPCSPIRASTPSASPRRRARITRWRAGRCSAGKHVLVEKPLATDATDAEELVDARRAQRELDADARPHVPLQPAGQQDPAT